MEKGLKSDSYAPSGPVDKSRVYDVRPLRCIVPVFPNARGMSSISATNPSHLVCISPSCPGFQPFYPFLVSNDSQHTKPGCSDFGSAISAGVPLNPFRTPQANGETSQAWMTYKTRGLASVVVEGDGYSDSQNHRGLPMNRKGGSGEDIDVESLANGETSQARRTYETRGSASVVIEGNGYSDSQNHRGLPRKRKGGSGEGINVESLANGETSQANGETSHALRTYETRGSASVVIEGNGYSDSQNHRVLPRKRKDGSGEDIDVESLANNFLTLFKLKEFDDFRRSSGDKDTTRAILMVYDLIRRKLTQLEEKNPGFARRPDLKACSLLMMKGVRTNNSKRIGLVPGIDVGDIFFFRMELCLVGLHAPSMAGIDYMSVKITANEEPLAVSIVSSGGGYEDDDDGDDSNMLIYSGQGRVARRDGQMFDQKLERGNLALEKSLHSDNDVRVIRGVKDPFGSASKIYVYDGLYKIQESWAEKNKSGCTVFKYKLIRQPGQPEAFSLWKSVQQWRAGNATRPGLITPDITSGAETQPVALVNDVDGEKGLAPFSYVPSFKYSQPFTASNPSSSCHCSGGCQSGDTSCPCGQRNDGSLPYSSLGVLSTTKPVIHECGQTCSCPSSCRNRMTQAGTKVRLEVFRTRNKGWGLRSWDPIRAGSFICEYAGDIIKVTADDSWNVDDADDYIFDASRYYQPLEPVHSATGIKKTPLPLVISSKNKGNISRFMNHSCSPNVFWQPVLRESNFDLFLHIGFFAIRHIPPMQELTYDYGIPEKAVQGKKCICRSVNCRGYFY